MLFWYTRVYKIHTKLAILNWIICWRYVYLDGKTIKGNQSDIVDIDEPLCCCETCCFGNLQRFRTIFVYLFHSILCLFPFFLCLASASLIEFSMIFHVLGRENTKNDSISLCFHTFISHLCFLYTWSSFCSTFNGMYSASINGKKMVKWQRQLKRHSFCLNLICMCAITWAKELPIQK